MLQWSPIPSGRGRCCWIQLQLQNRIGENTFELRNVPVTRLFENQSFLFFMAIGRIGVMRLLFRNL